ncbi:MAG TPA: MgtC/SapB family protein [Candidatus Acidoferrales bacterium]|nr:MgtC/SapB family protein [Candidatus Acidoferrales bacterium]
MDVLLEELAAGLPDSTQLARVLTRLLSALFFGAIIGVQRERSGKPAGVRTHMLVALGAVLFIVAPLESGMDPEAVSRVIQGLITGIGFLGGGAILKLHEEREIEGLTTAAGIWLTAAVGVAVGLGRIGLGLICVILAWVVLSLLVSIEARIAKQKAAKKIQRVSG